MYPRIRLYNFKMLYLVVKENARILVFLSHQLDYIPPIGCSRQHSQILLTVLLMKISGYCVGRCYYLVEQERVAYQITKAKVCLLLDFISANWGLFSTHCEWEFDYYAKHKYFSTAKWGFSIRGRGAQWAGQHTKKTFCYYYLTGTGPMFFDKLVSLDFPCGWNAQFGTVIPTCSP